MKRRMKNRMNSVFGSAMSLRLVAAVLVMMSSNFAHASEYGETFYPGTAKQQARLMEAFKKVFYDFEFKNGSVALPFKFEGRSRWHLNASIYKRCMYPGILSSEFCTRRATIPNLRGKTPAPKGYEKEFSINVNSKEIFYSCEARLFVGKEDRELTQDLLEEIQEFDPTVKGVPFVFVECACEPLALDHDFTGPHATGCDAFGYATDASGN